MVNDLRTECILETELFINGEHNVMKMKTEIHMFIVHNWKPCWFSKKNFGHYISS